MSGVPIALLLLGQQHAWPPVDQIESLTVPSLRALLADKGATKTGDRATLLQRALALREVAMRAQDAQESQAAQEAHQAEVKKKDHIESGMGIFPGFGSDFGSRSQELEAAQEVEGAEAAQPAVAPTEAAPPSPSSQPLGQMGTPERSSAPTAPPNTPATPQAPQGSPDAKESDSESELRRLRRLRRLETPPETSPHASDASDASGSKCSEGIEGNMLPVVLPPADLPLEALQKKRFWTPQTPGKKGKRFWTPSCQHSFALGQIPEEEPPFLIGSSHSTIAVMSGLRLLEFSTASWRTPSWSVSKLAAGMGLGHTQSVWAIAGQWG